MAGFDFMPFSLARETLDPADAGLVYVCSSEPGWTRRPHGRGFTYLDEQGDVLKDDDRERAEALVLPPAWALIADRGVCRRRCQAQAPDAADRS